MTDFKISDRLKSVADKIKKGSVVADIGTDHGYLPIYLIKNGITNKVIAMDLRKSPLEKARKNAENECVSESIDFRLSDGLELLDKLEADTIVVCGMGGYVIKRILEVGLKRQIFTDKTKFILSPHSEYGVLRKFLYENGFKITSEDNMYEKKWFYVIISAEFDGIPRHKQDYVYEYGEYGTECADNNLYKYLLHENSIILRVLDGLNKTKETQAVLKKKEEVKKALDINEKTLAKISHIIENKKHT